MIKDNGHSQGVKLCYSDAIDNVSIPPNRHASYTRKYVECYNYLNCIKSTGNVFKSASWKVNLVCMLFRRIFNIVFAWSIFITKVSGLKGCPFAEGMMPICEEAILLE